MDIFLFMELHYFITWLIYLLLKHLGINLLARGDGGLRAEGTDRRG